MNSFKSTAKPTRFNPEEYTISVRKELVDGEYYWVARVEELPDIMEFGDDREDAYQLALDTIEVGQEMCIEQGTPFPSPKVFEQSSYSGRVTLRLPKTVHALCVKQAENEDVSLNALIVNAIVKSQSKDEVNSFLLAELIELKQMISSQTITAKSAHAFATMSLRGAASYRSRMVVSEDDDEESFEEFMSTSSHANIRTYHA